MKIILWLMVGILVMPCFVKAEPLLPPGEKLEPPIWGKAETSLTWGLLLGTAVFSLLDTSVQHQLQKNQSDQGSDIADAIATMGSAAATLGVGGVLWGIGRWGDDPVLQETGLLALEAIVLSQVGAGVSKAIIGRHRPSSADNSHTFSPFTLDDDNHSFPSSHTAGAFALASVLSQRSQKTYAPLGYYALASLVGVARLYQDEHWLSDIIAGALIGELSARLVLNWNQNQKISVSLIPHPSKGAFLMAQIVW